MITCKPIHEDDFDNFAVPDYGYSYQRPDITLGDTLAFRRGVTILSLIGIVPMWKGVGQLWMMLSADVVRAPKELIKKQRVELLKMVVKRKYHRVQSIVPKEDKFIKWAEIHGFMHESNMLQAGTDGADMSMMAFYLPLQGE